MAKLGMTSIRKQLGIFANAVFDSESLCSDDKMLVALLLLTGARIEELYQLRAEDLEPNKDGWLVRIADQRQTGSGYSGPQRQNSFHLSLSYYPFATCD